VVIIGAKRMRLCGWAQPPQPFVAVVPGLYSLLPPTINSSQAVHANGVKHADIICDICKNHKAFAGTEMFHEVQILSWKEVQGKSLSLVVGSLVVPGAWRSAVTRQHSLRQADSSFSDHRCFIISDYLHESGRTATDHTSSAFRKTGIGPSGRNVKPVNEAANLVGQTSASSATADGRQLAFLEKKP
jgi:hypothetical protein